MSPSSPSAKKGALPSWAPSEPDAADRLLRALYEDGPDVVLTLDRDHRVQAINAAGARQVGQDPARIVGHSVLSLLEEESGTALLTLLLSGFEGHSSARVTLRDGRRMTLSLYRAEGDPTLLVFRDATELYRMEQELARMRGLASVGQLTADLAHGISNPLAVVQGWADLLQSQPELNPELVHQKLDVMLDHCQRIRRIIENLQTIAAPTPPRRSAFPVRFAVQEALKALGRRREQVRITDRVTPDTMDIQADPQQLRQLLVNLLTQAIEASPQGGRVRITASPAETGYVTLAVEDEGLPLSPAKIAALAAANSSPDACVPGPEIGLPLVISWILAREHGGSLRAETRQPLGTRYVVTLPRYAGASPLRQHAAQPGGSAPCILVVDDDKILCETVTWLLVREGYRIEAVHSAEEALRKLNYGKFDLILTDIRLPGMDGEALVDAIRERSPALADRIILTSGLVSPPRRANPYLQKPFSPAQLLQLIREMQQSAPAP